MYIFDDIHKKAENHFENSNGSHDWDHTNRVYKLAMHIGEKENVDMEILKIATVLHDIGRGYQDESKGRICHAEKGAELAREFLAEYKLAEDMIEKIEHCIRTHRYRGQNIPESIEAKVLFDADKLDAIGAVGIGRAFLFAGEHGAKMHNSRDVDITQTEEYTKEDTAYREFEFKLKKIRERMLTNEGRRLAEQRHEFMVYFFDRLNNEVDGHI
jgi:uncharacterized protein